MIGRKKSKTVTVTLEKIGFALFLIYCGISYFATDIYLSSRYVQLFLYAFLGCSFLVCINRGKVLVTEMNLWQAAFLVLSLFAVLYSQEYLMYSTDYWALIVNFLMIFFLTQYNLTVKEIEKIGWVYAMSSMVLILLMIFTGYISSIEGRLGNEYSGNANGFSISLMVTVFFSLWLLIYGSSRTLWKNSLLLVSIALNYYGMFMSGGRKFVIIPLIFLYILLLMKTDKNGRRHYIKNTVIVAACVALLFYLVMEVPLFYDTIGNRLESLLKLFGGSTEGVDNSALVRQRMIRMAMEKWVEKPILGYGFNSYRYYNYEVAGHFYYSHNNFTELLYNQGIIGFTAYYFFYIKLLLNGMKNKSNASLKSRAFAIAMVISMLVFEYGAVNYTNTTTAILLLFAYTIATSPDPDQPENEGEQK